MAGKGVEGFRFNARRDLGEWEWANPGEYVVTSRPDKVRPILARRGVHPDGDRRQGLLGRIRGWLRSRMPGPDRASQVQ